MTGKLQVELVDLAGDLVTGEKITLETTKGWFDAAELDIYWYKGFFECLLTTYVEIAHYPATLYQPAETDYQESNETASLRKIREVSEWAKSHGFEISAARRSR